MRGAPTHETPAQLAQGRAPAGGTRCSARHPTRVGRLHLFFVAATFKEEAFIHISEGVPWTPTEFSDNMGCVELLDQYSAPRFITHPPGCYFLRVLLRVTPTPPSDDTRATLHTTLRSDLERLKKIRAHRGLRHYWNIRVRGQHTKSTGRRGKTMAAVKK